MVVVTTVVEKAPASISPSLSFSLSSSSLTLSFAIKEEG